MEGKQLIQTVLLKNFLSYGSEEKVIPLEPLNVLIGPNASGKSNLIEAFSLLRATPTEQALTAQIRAGGGVKEWLWKGENANPIAEIEATVYYPEGTQPLRYRLNFTMIGQRFEIVDEVIENERPRENENDVYFFYRYQNGHPVLNLREKIEEQAGTNEGRTRRQLRREDISSGESILSQRKDPDQYPEITYLGKQFDSMKLYREWNLGRNTEPRKPQAPDLAGDFLSESAKNLGLVLNDLEYKGGTYQLIIEKLQEFYNRAQGYSIKIYGGTVQLFIREKDLFDPIPATRLSDGTLRYLCLLAILCHPSPPPLICIEEPEIGLHPDILPTVADLLRDASKRAQLIVTTHSDVLVSALAEIPNSILVCEHDTTGTHLTRLDPGQLKKWLEDYSLGELWLKGEIGGTKW